MELAAFGSCAKSQRGCVVFDPATSMPVGAGVNRPPAPFACDGSDACRRDCDKICAHAEQSAIQVALEALARYGGYFSGLHGLELVHGKFVGGELVAGGGPSCWQCSRAVLGHGLAGVWLYEAHEKCVSRDCGRAAEYQCARDDFKTCKKHKGVCCVRRDDVLEGGWRFHEAFDFHRLTLASCELPGHRP